MEILKDYREVRVCLDCHRAIAESYYEFEAEGEEL